MEEGVTTEAEAEAVLYRDFGRVRMTHAYVHMTPAVMLCYMPEREIHLHVKASGETKDIGSSAARRSVPILVDVFGIAGICPNRTARRCCVHFRISIFWKLISTPLRFLSTVAVDRSRSLDMQAAIFIPPLPFPVVRKVGPDPLREFVLT